MKAKGREPDRKINQFAVTRLPPTRAIAKDE
jgi:hypothetical protein